MVVLQDIADIHNKCQILDDIIHQKNLYYLNSIDNWVKNKSINSNHLAFIYQSVHVSVWHKIAFDFTTQNTSHSWKSIILLKINLEAYLKFKHVYELGLQWYKTQRKVLLRYKKNSWTWRSLLLPVQL